MGTNLIDLESAVENYFKAIVGDCPFCDLKQNAECKCYRLEIFEEKVERDIVTLVKKYRRSHACEHSQRELLEQIYNMGDAYSGESLGIYRCEKCRRLWKIRFQRHAGTGSDNIWLRPGEKERGYEFGLETAVKYRDAASNKE